MAEHVQRYRQYEYRANSNLVLTADTHRPRTDEPSGEAESLKEHLDGTKFGDRVHFSKPDGGRKRKAGSGAGAGKRNKKESDNVLALTDDIDTYRPRSKETRAAYEDLLSLVSRQLGDQPHDILRGAADEVIACLKTDTLSDPERKKEVEKLINTLSTETFAQFVQCGKRINDYAVDDGAGNEKLDDELGVAVVFDEDDDDDPDVQDGRNDDDDAIVAEDISDEEDGGGAPISPLGRRPASCLP